MSDVVRSRCLLCQGDSSLNMPLCGYCLDYLPQPEALCPQCGLPMPDSVSELCAQCLQKKPPFDYCLTAFLYSYPVNHIIQKIKYSQRLELIPSVISPLVDVLIDHYVDRSWPEAIIPVPLHKKKLRVRGFNQSLLLAKCITQTLHNELQDRLKLDIVKKHKATQPQQSLSVSQRRKNIKGAFSLQENIGYKHVAIIDDVVTSSETVGEISRLMKKNGIQQVDVWCLARTPSLHN